MGARGPLPFTARPGTTAGTAATRAEPMPDPPDWLTEGAAAEYRRLVALHPHWTAADASILTTHAQAVDEHAAISRRLTVDTITSKAGTGGEYLNPLFNARSTAQKTIERTALQLGLTPAARARSGQPGAGQGQPHQPTTGPAAFAAMHGDDAA